MDNPTNRVDVATAAERLGITPEAVYKRIRRGQLQANRLDGRWFVQLDGLDHHNGQADQPDEPPNQPPDEPPSSGSSSSSTAHLADLHAEVQFLRAQVEALEERLRESHVLLAAALEVRQLPEPAISQFANTPWWSWRRWWPWG